MGDPSSLADGTPVEVAVAGGRVDEKVARAASPAAPASGVSGPSNPVRVD